MWPAPADAAAHRSPAAPAADHREHRPVPGDLHPGPAQLLPGGRCQRVEVDGLDGLHYLDKYEDYAQLRLQQGPWSLRDPRDPGRSDRIYTGAGGHYVLRDPVLQRRIEIRSEGSQTLVAWNPGAEAAAKMADVGEGWRDYVCLEVANAGPEQITLRRARATSWCRPWPVHRCRPWRSSEWMIDRKDGMQDAQWWYANSRQSEGPVDLAGLRRCSRTGR
jgi:hypothetical protein